METLAFLLSYVAYEDPRPQPQLQTLKKLLRLQMPSSAWLRFTSIAITLSILLPVTDAIAALRYGDVGPSVLEAQQALVQAGHDPGPVDGVFGGATEYAVIRFQERVGLFVDGIIGPATAAALGISDSGGGGGGGYNGDSGYLGDGSGGYYGDSGYLGGGGGGGMSSGMVRVATNGTPLNVRSGPGENYSVIDALPNGLAVPTTGRVIGGWIELQGGGWVASIWVF